MTSEYIFLFAVTFCVQLLFIHSTQAVDNDCQTDDNRSGKCVRLSDCHPRPTSITVCMAGIRGVCCPTATVVPQPTNTRDGENACSTADGSPGSCLRVNDCVPRPQNAVVCIGSRRGICCPAGTGISTVSECGRDLLQEEILKALVLGGTNADEGTWPWMMALFKKTSDGLRYQCGGAVIRRQYLLTAAHCFDEDRNEENYNIRVGGYDVSKPVQGDVPGAEEVQMEELIIHPKYERRRFNNDIALIKLSKPIKRTDQQICLPTGQIQTRGGQNAQLTGWGLTVEGAGQEGDHSALLQQVSLPIQDTDDCRDTYVDRLKNTFGSNFPEGIDDSKFICAGDQHAKKDACRGDSGGPLMIKDSDGKFFAVGVVSVGGSLCGKNLPTLFTKVETYSEWISQIVNR